MVLLRLLTTDGKKKKRGGGIAGAEPWEIGGGAVIFATGSDRSATENRRMAESRCHASTIRSRWLGAGEESEHLVLSFNLMADPDLVPRSK